MPSSGTGLKGSPTFLETNAPAFGADLTEVSAWAANNVGAYFAVDYASLPTDNYEGRLAFAADTGGIYVYRVGTGWVLVASDSGWISPVNYLSTFTAGAQAVKSRLIDGNRVDLAGFAANGSVAAGTNGNVLTLPVGHRPSTTRYLSLVAQNANRVGRVSVSAGGIVTVESGGTNPGTITEVHFDGLFFYLN